MPEWSVRLKGHEFDLEELSDHFRSSERNVTKDEDGHYYLRSTDFDSMADDEAVRERALELVELMNRAAKFHAGDGLPARKTLTAPRSNVGNGYRGPMYCLSCNPRFSTPGEI
jgi:hypothetical protein